MTRVIRMTRVVRIRSRGILWIVIQILYIYTVMTGSEDQELNLSIWTDIHTHTHTHIYFHFIYMCLQCICYVFLENVC